MIPYATIYHKIHLFDLNQTKWVWSEIQVILEQFLTWSEIKFVRYECVDCRDPSFDVKILKQREDADDLDEIDEEEMKMQELVKKTKWQVVLDRFAKKKFCGILAYSTDLLTLGKG